jgi:hypothetical protein
MTQAGAQGRGTVFLFADTQLKDESFLEDLNNILNTGASFAMYAVLLGRRAPAMWQGMMSLGSNALLGTDLSVYLISPAYAVVVQDQAS